MDPDSQQYTASTMAEAAEVLETTHGQWRARYGLLKGRTLRFSLLDTCVVRAVAVLSKYSFKMDEVVALADGRIREQLAEILRQRMQGRHLGTIIRLFEGKEVGRPATVVWLELNTITDHVIDFLRLDLPIKRLSKKERIKQLDQVLAYLDTPTFRSRVEALRELWTTAGPQSWHTISIMLGVPFWVVQMALSENKSAKPPLRPIVKRIADELGVKADTVAVH